MKEEIKLGEFIPGFEYVDIRYPNIGYTVNKRSNIDYKLILEYVRRKNN